MNNLLENKYVVWLKKTAINLFGDRYYTFADLFIMILICKTQSWWVGIFAIVWILIVSPILVAAKENLDKLEQKEQDEHSQL